MLNPRLFRPPEPLTRFMGTSSVLVILKIVYRFLEYLATAIVTGVDVLVTMP